MTRKEEFEKLVVDILLASGNTPLQEKKTDELYNWHISEMMKLLEKIEKEIITQSIGKEKLNPLTKTKLKIQVQNFAHKCVKRFQKHQLLQINDLKEELK